MLLLRCLHGRQFVTGKSIVKNFLRSCTSGNVQGTAPPKSQETVELKSKVFPDHDIIYAFPSIRYVSAFNTGKLLSTGIGLIGTVTVAALYGTDFISWDVAVASESSLVMTSIWFHLAGIALFDNFIGCIYTKEDDDKAIISYVNYWGTRKNMVIDIPNIVPLDEVRKNFTSFAYRKLHIVCGTDGNKVRKLRMYLGKGVTMKEVELRSIIGSWD